MAGSRGGGGSLKSLAWAFIVACIAVAMFRGVLSDPQGFYNDLKVKATQLEQTVNKWVDDAGLDKGGSKSAPAPSTAPAAVPSSGG